MSQPMEADQQCTRIFGQLESNELSSYYNQRRMIAGQLGNHQLTSILDVVHSQSWNGIYTTELACDTTSCCCLVGQIVFTSTSANTYTVNSLVSGSDCNGVTTYSGYLHINGYTGWMVVFSANTSVTLNADSSFFTVTNWDNPFCSILGLKNGIAKLDDNRSDEKNRITRTAHVREIVTNIPTELNNCTIETEQLYCLVEIEWKEDPKIETTIRLAGYTNPYPRSSFPPHTLEVNAYIPHDPNRFEREVRHFLRYSCPTDQCNQPAVLKSLLESLIMNDQLNELEHLLKSNQTFDRQWCLSSGNVSYLQSNASQNCNQCVNYLTYKDGWKATNAFCYTIIYPQNRLGYEVTFDLKDQTRSHKWIIHCQGPNCSSANNMNQITKNIQIEFDAKTFLKRTSAAVSTVHSMNFHKIILMCFLVLFVELF
ncbi:hypothetical protein I4U23_011256 [Adineta vaga]|nr:hypothetical protein I4U23_011256 [Adineta vaga]